MGKETKDTMGDELSLEAQLERISAVDDKKDESPRLKDIEEKLSGKTPAKKSGNEDSKDSKKTDEELATLRKRYEDSSREGKRLAQQLREIEPLMPLINALQNDDGLLKVVSSYLQGGDTPKGKSVKEALSLGDDFVFDVDEALDNPDSKSAKALNALVEQRASSLVASEVNKHLLPYKQQMADLEMRNELGMDSQKFEEFKKFMNSTKMTAKDAYYLFNRDEHEKEIRRQAQKEIVESLQRKGLVDLNALADIGGEEKQESNEEQLFKAVLSSQGFNADGIEGALSGL